ncbi:MAG: T9SS type A sorting domain-containing protein [Bacteroidota bacterium]
MKIYLPVTCLMFVVVSLEAQNVSFSQPTGSPISTNTTAVRGITSADLNGDGNKDFVAGTAYGTSLNIYLGAGNGQFTAAPGSPMTAGNGPISSAIADFNNDGKPDIATANYNGGNISINLGTGTGSFTPASPSSYTTGSSPYWIEAKDFNMDSKMDLVTVSAGTAKAYVFLGAGNGTFSVAAGSPYNTGTGPYHVSTGLFNNDNFPDFAVANGLSANVSVFLGTGTGSFTPAPSSPYTVGTEPRTLSAKDVNNDGRPDLIVANATSANVSVLLGQTTGSFTTAVGSPITAGTYPYQTAVADYNSDGHQDFSVTNGAASATGNGFRVFLGNSTGSFTEALNSPLTATSAPQPISTDDFNGDGKADLLVGTFLSNKVNVYLNTNAVSVNELHKTKYVNIYPNPSAEVIVIKVNEPKTGMEFFLYNELGQEVDKLLIIDKETQYLRRNLAKGIYTYSVLYNKEVVESGKIVFE